MITTLFAMMGALILRLIIFVRITTPLIIKGLIHKTKCYKVTDSLTQLVYYSTIVFYMVNYVFSENFVLFGSNMSSLLSVQLGYYIQAILTENNSDYKIMITHHIITISLILFAKITNAENFGIAICLVHDCSDPFLHIAKLLNYGKFNTILRDIVFAIFAVVFITTRLMVFPILAHYYYKMTGLNAGTVGLCCLQAMHAYWSFLIAKMVCKVIRGQEIKDDDG